jgi:hypothetical protein
MPNAVKLYDENGNLLQYSPEEFYHGQTTVSTPGTEVALGESQELVIGQVTIKAFHANTGFIYVGMNPVSASTGFVLDAGEQTVIFVENVETIYIDASVGDEGVSWQAS